MIRKWVKLRILIPVALFFGFAVIAYGLIISAPQSKRNRVKYIAPVVEIMDVEIGAFDVTIQAQGLVKPAQKEVELRPQVGGKVIGLHAHFEPGGRIPAGEVIIQIEKIDYQLILGEAKANLARAEASVDLERGQQQIAREEFELLEGDFVFDDASKALALRVPQLKQLEAERAVAQNAYERARISLGRTELSLPYDTFVLETLSVMGEVISPGVVAGKFARADRFWVELRVQQKHLGRLRARTHKRAGSSVMIRSNGYDYRGELVSLRVNLVAATRLGGAIVEVLNPDYANRTNEKPPLLIGSHVEAVLEAGGFENMYKIPRSALLENNMVYVVDREGRLQWRLVNILWEMPESLIIKPGFEQGDRLVVSRVSGVAPGTIVKTRYPVRRLAYDTVRQKGQGLGQSTGQASLAGKE